MQIACPTCRQALLLPSGFSGTAVQCPKCQGVIPLAGSAPRPAPQAMPVRAAATSAGPARTGAAAVAVKTPPASPAAGVVAPAASAASTYRRRRRRQSSGWLLGIGAILVACGAAYGVVVMNRKQTAEKQQQALAQLPERVAYDQACVLIRDHLKKESKKAARNAAFAADPERTQRSVGGLWRISSHVDVPQKEGASTRRRFVAEVQQVGGVWKLMQLNLDGDLVVAEAPAEKVDVTFDSDKEDNWLADMGVDMKKIKGPGKDYYADMTVGWGLQQVTKELSATAEIQKLLVVWLIDRSASAATHRNQLSQGIAAAYGEIEKAAGSADESGEAKVVSAVAGVAKAANFALEEPTSDFHRVEAVINELEQDETGTENIFAAIREAVEKYQPIRAAEKRSLWIVLVSDEAGDDDSTLEGTVELLKRNNVSLSVVGTRAPFGRRAMPGANAEIANDLGTSGKNPNLIKQGPEMPQSDNINLAFFNPNLGADDMEYMDSGFGPYALCRLAKESGGTYYACRTDIGGGMRSGRGAIDWNPAAGFMYTFDPKVMRKYAPEYLPEDVFRKSITENKCRQALLNAAKFQRVETMSFVRTDFPKPRDEAAGKVVLDEAQKSAAKLEPRIASLYDALKAGEKDREKETNPRWQAAFDVAMGRVLAAKVRTEGYNAMLAQLKGGFSYSREDSLGVRLVPADKIGAGSAFERMLKDSKKYLQRVKDEHPGTPWAMMAERELDVPMGWEWKEVLPTMSEEPAAGAADDET